MRDWLLATVAFKRFGLFLTVEQYKPLTTQTAINNAKQWQHQQPFVPTWAVRSRATCFPNGQQTRNLKHYFLTIVEDTLRKPEPHPRRREKRSAVLA